MIKILYATTNNHKIRLFKLAFEKQGLSERFELLTLKDLDENLVKSIPDIDEDTGTFGGDSEKKAKTYAKHTGLPTISQDRGFIFDAINWPGTLTKEAFTGSEKTLFHNFEETKHLYFENARKMLEKIDGLDRKMTVIQGLSVALPNGEVCTEEFFTHGKADLQAKMGLGGMFDWFFIPNGLNHSLTEFATTEELDDYVSEYLYPITPKIIEFLKNRVAENLKK